MFLISLPFDMGWQIIGYFLLVAFIIYFLIQIIIGYRKGRK